MNTSASLIVIVSVLVFSVGGYKISQPQQQQHGSHHRGRPPLLFDEFLLKVVRGEVDLMSDGTVSEPSEPSSARSSLIGQFRAGLRDESNNTNTEEPVHNTLRMLRHRQEPDVETGSGQMADPDSEEDLEEDVFTIASRRVMNNVASPRRRHSRRDLNGGSSNHLGQIGEELRGIDRRHWSCCLLGELAGDKGFLCEAQFYASRVLDRLPNRVHNRRMSAYFQNGRTTETGEELIETFNNCVQTRNQAAEFESCCSRTFSQYEQRESRWRDFREYALPRQ